LDTAKLLRGVNIFHLRFPSTLCVADSSIDSFAHFARSTASLTPTSIAIVECVAVLTVSYLAQSTLANHRRKRSTPQVLGAGHRLQMIRIEASSIAAKMVNLQAKRDGPMA
jgi:hypothetical protein